MLTVFLAFQPYVNIVEVSSLHRMLTNETFVLAKFSIQYACAMSTVFPSHQCRQSTS